jgi:putative copper export protein
MQIAEIALVVAHVCVAAVWLGGMVYSLVVVQPKAARLFRTDDETYETFLTTMASGNRTKVLGLIAALAGTGLLLLAAEPQTGQQLWFHAAKGLLLLAALAVFVDVSWRQWPRRLFALPEERPQLRARFQRSAYVLFALVALAFALGLVASRLSQS